MNRSKPRNGPRRCSTGSIMSVDELLSNSPRQMMSSLQLHRSPSDGALKETPSSDLTAEKILSERRVGRFKGRKLFQDGGETASDERVVCGASSEESHLFSGAEERGRGSMLRGGGGVVAISSLVIVSILFILGLILISCSGKAIDQNRSLLPT